MRIYTTRHYAEELWKDIEEQRGERPRMLRHLVEKTAADQRHLAQIDDQLDGADFTTIASGSMGQTKTEVNPLLAHRDKVSRTITDDLEALQLTARSLYKKKDATPAPDEDDPTRAYFETVNR